MNKLNSGKTITIKINGKKRPFFEESNSEEPPISENQLTQPEIGPIQAENDAIVETAAAKELDEDSFEWILPDQTEIQNETSLYKLEKATKQRKGIRLPALSKVERKNVGPLKSILLSVFFAVMLGTSFGILMLKLVITDHGKPAAVQTPAAPSKEKNSNITNSSSQAAISLHPLTFYLVQGGVFTKKETAQKIASETISKGIPAETLELNGQYYLFLGAANSVESARNLGNKYQDKGMDGVFPKTLIIPEKKLSNLTKDEKGWMENALFLVPILANVSAKAEDGGALPNNEVKLAGEIEKKLEKIDSKGIKNKKINDLKQELTGAMKQIKAYQQKKEHKALVNVQQHLLTFLTVYYSL